MTINLTAFADIKYMRVYYFGKNQSESRVFDLGGGNSPFFHLLYRPTANHMKRLDTKAKKELSEC